MMMTDRDGEILTNNIVSDRTLRTDHLLCSFYGYLKRYNPDAAKRIYLDGNNAQVLDLAAEESNDLVMSGEFDDPECMEIITQLEDALSDLAPEGYSFSVHPGDGACFGFWKDEEE